MGACLSCLGLGGDGGSESERRGLLYSDDPYGQPGGYGTSGGIGAPGIPPQNLMSAEEVRREQEALDNITRWATDQVVEIFPHHPQNMTMSTSQLSGADSHDPHTSTHQDILLSMIPGDKSRKSIRIYPASSRPGSATGQRSIRSKSSSTRLNGVTRSKDAGVMVKINIDMP